MTLTLGTEAKVKTRLHVFIQGIQGAAFWPPFRVGYKEFCYFTLGKATCSYFVPDHHFCIFIVPVIPLGGAPW